MALDMIIQEAKGMSDEALMEVVRFMKFIKLESRNISASTSDTGVGKKRIRSAGMYRGQGWMSDDFDEPLDDFKEYM